MAMRSLFLLALVLVGLGGGAAVLAAPRGAAGGGGECAGTKPDHLALKLAPCASAVEDPDAAPSGGCCAAARDIGRRHSPECLCALLLSDTVAHSGVDLAVIITIPKRCNLATRPVGYKCGGARPCFPSPTRPYSPGTAASNLSPSATPRCHSLLGFSHALPLKAQRRRGPNAFQPSITKRPRRHSYLVLCTPAVALRVPTSSSSFCSYQFHSHGSTPKSQVHGGNGCTPSQPCGADGQAAAAASPAGLPRPPAAAPPAARGPGRAGDEGGGGEDGRGDHREVRARVRPLESVQLQGGGGGEEEVADRPGQGAPGQVRRRVPGHLHLPLPRLLHPLLPPHQRRRRRAGDARQGRDRDRGDRGEGRDLRAGLRRAQGRVADKVPAHGGADAGGGRLDRQDQEGQRLTRQSSSSYVGHSVRCALLLFLLNHVVYAYIHIYIAHYKFRCSGRGCKWVRCRFL